MLREQKATPKVVLEKTLESPVDCKEIQPVHSEGDQPWYFFGRNDAKAETPVLWPPHAKSWLTGKDSDAGRDWVPEEKGTTEDEMAGWHYWLDGREPEWTPGVGDGQGGLLCCDSWGRKGSDTTERLNWTELKVLPVVVLWKGEGLSTLSSPVFQEKPEIWVLIGDLKKTWYHKMEYWVTKMNELPVYAAKWINSNSMMLSERRKKTTYRINPFIWNVQSRQIYIEND